MGAVQEQETVTTPDPVTAICKSSSAVNEPGEHQAQSTHSITEKPKPIVEKKSPKSKTEASNFFTRRPLAKIQGLNKIGNSTTSPEVTKGRFTMLKLPNQQFFSYRLFRGPKCERVRLHYIKSFDDAEACAHLFLDCKVIGLDTEFKPRAGNSIKKNVSLIQVASETDIALFHIAAFPGEKPDDLIPPTLKSVFADEKTFKSGSNVGGDVSRLEKWLNCPVKGAIHLKMLLQIVHEKERGQRASLDIMTRRYFSLGMNKNSSTRCGNWTQELDREQLEYAASDAYASLKVYQSIDDDRRQKRLPQVRHLMAANHKRSAARKRKASESSVPTLLDALHTLRAQLANKHNLEVHRIMTNNEMKAIAAAEPMDLWQLCEVPDCGLLITGNHAEAIVQTVVRVVQDRQIGAKRGKMKQGDLKGWRNSKRASDQEISTAAPCSRSMTIGTSQSDEVIADCMAINGSIGTDPLVKQTRAGLSKRKDSSCDIESDSDFSTDNMPLRLRLRATAGESDSNDDEMPLRLRRGAVGGENHCESGIASPPGQGAELWLKPEARSRRTTATRETAKTTADGMKSDDKIHATTSSQACVHSTVPADGEQRM
jgi:ribonuclease D